MVADERRGRAGLSGGGAGQVWPPGCACEQISENVWDGRIPIDVRTAHGVGHGSTTTRHAAEGGRIATRSVRIREIPAASNHPAAGQFGLFAAEPLPPNTWLLDYKGFVSDDAHCSKTSDYIVGLGNGLSIDAEHVGCEARFVNDYRGIGDRANLAFKTSVGAGSPPGMEIWTASQPIETGSELLLSYGKGFWKSRKG